METTRPNSVILNLTLRHSSARRGRRLAAWVVAALTAACGDLPTATRPGPPQPVITIQLVTNTTEQVANVQYTTPADSIVVVVPRPIAAESVALAIRTSDGSEVPLTPLPGDSGLYGFNLSVLPGATYHLVGTVVGRTIAAQTTVPGPMIVREPAGDTLRIASDAQGNIINREVPYAWHAAGAAVYGIGLTDTIAPLSQYLRLYFDTSGVLSPHTDLRTPFVLPQVLLFRVLAYDSRLGPDGNIAGALGWFTSASVLDPPKVILWP